MQLIQAKSYKAQIWVSFEPVINADVVLDCLRYSAAAMDMVKIGKLNYHKSDIIWRNFGTKAEKICQEQGIAYYIKESLRAEMM